MARTTDNKVLLSLPAGIREELLGACTRVEMVLGSVLHREGETTKAVHFPDTGVISTLATYGDGSVIEMANIGREASTGINLVLGNPRQLNTDEIQVAGTALEMPAEKFVKLMSSRPEFARALFSMVQAVFQQVMVSGACNGAHGATERLARWLLTMRDRSDGDEMHLTHEFLAEVLGLRRATVSESAAELRRAGLIDYARGRIWIADRAGLEAASCECYRRVRESNDALLPGAGPKR